MCALPDSKILVVMCHAILIGSIIQKPSVGNTADKIVLGYQMANGPQIDEDVSGKCQNAIAYLEKMEKEIGSHSNSGIRV